MSAIPSTFATLTIARSKPGASRNLLLVAWFLGAAFRRRRADRLA
jgi:hypothetical protein